MRGVRRFFQQEIAMRSKAAMFAAAGWLVLFLFLAIPAARAQDTARTPNILVIMGNDIGIWNLSTYHQGMMGYDAPHIDRLAQERGKFMTYYAQQSCTAGRSAFITGQLPFRTGLSKVGLPGADLGIRKEDPTIAELLKPLGYMTGQFGKNHLGDKDEFLPTNHGFDEFYGNLYHLNAEEEPENPDYPKNPELRKKFGPRGVIRSTADEKADGDDRRGGAREGAGLPRSR
jgi:arylsulfatase